jgi:hypothetical protein
MLEYMIGEYHSLYLKDSLKQLLMSNFLLRVVVADLLPVTNFLSYPFLWQSNVCISDLSQTDTLMGCSWSMGLFPH